MRFFRSTSAIVILFSLWIGSVAAQSIVPKLDENGRRGEMARMVKEKSAAQFDQADVNKDGKLSKEEVSVVSNYFAENFEKRDLDKDGFLNWKEFVGHDRWAK